MYDDIQSAAESGLTVSEKNKGLTKTQRKKAELQKQAVELAAINTVNELSADETFALLTTALKKEVHDRTEAENLAIAAQQEFVIELLLKAQEENAKLDKAHNQKIDEIQEMQRKALAEVQSIFNEAWESHNRMVKAVNSMPDEAVAILTEAFGSNDPNA